MIDEGCKDMYDRFCKERFDKIDIHQEKLMELLKGRNGNPGLIEDVRTIKRRWTLIAAAVGLLFLPVLNHLVDWLFQVL